MTHKGDEVERLLRGLGVPRAPLELRQTTLSRAEAALGREVIDPWRRVWADRRLRWAWATTVVVLVVANLAVGARRPSGATGAAYRLAGRVAGDGELAPLVELPRIDSRFVNMDVTAAGIAGAEGSRS